MRLGAVGARHHVLAIALMMLGRRVLLLVLVLLRLRMLVRLQRLSDIGGPHPRRGRRRRIRTSGVLKFTLVSLTVAAAPVSAALLIVRLVVAVCWSVRRGEIRGVVRRRRRRRRVVRGRRMMNASRRRLVLSMMVIESRRVMRIRGTDGSMLRLHVRRLRRGAEWSRRADVACGVVPSGRGGGVGKGLVRRRKSSGARILTSK